MSAPPHQPGAAALARKLERLLRELGERMEDYQDYLKQLHEAIRDNDTPRLEQLLPQDQALQQPLGGLLELRQQMLDDLGVESLSDLLRVLGNPPQLLRARDGVERKLDNLRQQLASNDILLRRSRQRLRQTIGILAGHFDTHQSGTYCRDGALTHCDSQHSLARA